MKVAPQRGETVIAWVLVLIASGILFASWRMPAGMSGQPGPGFFPTGIGTVLLVAGFALVLRSRRGEPSGVQPDIQFGHTRIWVTLLALAGTAFALEPVGYLPTSAALLAVLLRCYGRTGWIATVLGAVAGAGLSWFFFHTLLGVSLPSGLLGLR